MRKPAAARAVLSCLVLLAAASIGAQEASPRTVFVKIAVDQAIPDPLGWSYQANRLLGEAFRTFRKQYGIRLAIRDRAGWQPDKEKKSMPDALVDLRAKVPSEDSDIVLGIVDPGRIKSPSLGIASYPHGYILLCYVNSFETMPYSFLRELCHVFGAIDLKEKGSVMSVFEPGLAIDEFTAQTVLLHRGRSFDRTSFPLAKDRLADAVSLYKQRTDRDLGEPQLLLYLTLFYIEMNDLESAARACGQAAAADPGSPVLHILLGNICLNRGQTQQAIAEYTTALRFQPGEPGTHFNLALAYIQERNFSAAANECRAAIALNPDYAQARSTLAQLELAAGNSESAATDLGMKKDGQGGQE